MDLGEVKLSEFLFDFSWKLIISKMSPEMQKSEQESSRTSWISLKTMNPVSSWNESFLTSTLSTLSSRLKNGINDKTTKWKFGPEDWKTLKMWSSSSITTTSPNTSRTNVTSVVSKGKKKSGQNTLSTPEVKRQGERHGGGSQGSSHQVLSRYCDRGRSFNKLQIHISQFSLTRMFLNSFVTCFSGTGNVLTWLEKRRCLLRNFLWHKKTENLMITKFPMITKCPNTISSGKPYQSHAQFYIFLGLMIHFHLLVNCLRVVSIDWLYVCRVCFDCTSYQWWTVVLYCVSGTSEWSLNVSVYDPVFREKKGPGFSFFF